MSDGSRFSTPHRNGDTSPRVALVLPGGGARGAYEVGALSVLLPLLEERGERPVILCGTSVGAINATALGATADQPAAVAVQSLIDHWRGLRKGNVDQVVDDLHRLATINSFVVDSQGPGPRGAADAYRAARGRNPYRKISYALVAPERRGELAAIADEVFEDRYAGMQGWLRPDYPFMSRLLGGGRSPSRGELLSFLLFDEEHVDRLVELGARDARRWLERHPNVWCSDASHDFDIDTGAVASLREREALDEWRDLRRRP